MTGTERLLSAIERAGWKGRFVHVSSFAVYAFNQLPAGATVDEETPLEPDPGRRDDYAWTKLLQERRSRPPRRGRRRRDRDRAPGDGLRARA